MPSSCSTMHGDNPDVPKQFVLREDAVRLSAASAARSRSPSGSSARKSTIVESAEETLTRSVYYSL